MLRCIAAGTDSVQVVEMPIVDSVHPRPPFMPQAIPADLAPRLMRLHGHPFVWWIAQFVSYLFRLQPRLLADVEMMQQKLGFRHPIVGLVALCRHICWRETHSCLLCTQLMCCVSSHSSFLYVSYLVRVY